MTYGSMSIVQTIVVRALMPVIVSVSVQPVASSVFDVPVVLVQEIEVTSEAAAFDATLLDRASRARS